MSGELRKDEHIAVVPNRTLCISGKLPSGRKKADYEEQLQALGIELVDVVNSHLTYLVVADAGMPSSKSEKAKKLGISVISESELITLIAAASPADVRTDIEENIEEMSSTQMLDLVQGPHITAKRLGKLVNRYVEVNRLIAGHPKSTKKILRELAEYWDDETDGKDVEALKIIVRNPNAPEDLLVELAQKFPVEFLQNPLLLRWVSASPEILADIPQILELAGCPEAYMRYVANSGFDFQKLQVLKNLSLPEDVRAQLSPDYFLNEAQQSLTDQLESEDDRDVRDYLEAYRKKSLSYCIPRFAPFNKLDPKHRLGDQVVRGFPFTSANWPWPRAANGEPLQPAAQIDLQSAGARLNAKLGTGLLQVWLEDQTNPMIRQIPALALDEEMDTYFPESARWNVESDDQDRDICTFYLYQSQLPYPRVEWVDAGRMFPRPLQSMADWCMNHSDFDEEKMEELSDQVTNLGIPMMESMGEIVARVHLGGYPRGYGNEGAICDWTAENEWLLLYLCPDNGSGVCFTLQVTWSFDPDGLPKFAARVTCDR